MADFYRNHLTLYPRHGRTLERPATPPDKSAMFWDRERRELWLVGDDMEWYKVNSELGLYTLRHDFSYLQAPEALIISAIPNTRILDVRLRVATGFDQPLSVGDSANHERLATEADIIYGTPGRYKTEPDHDYSSPTNVSFDPRITLL